jgi:hypothetical protein
METDLEANPVSPIFKLKDPSFPNILPIGGWRGIAKSPQERKSRTPETFSASPGARAVSIAWVAGSDTKAGS